MTTHADELNFPEIQVLHAHRPRFCQAVNFSSSPNALSQQSRAEPKPAQAGRESVRQRFDLSEYYPSFASYSFCHKKRDFSVDKEVTLEYRWAGRSIFR